MDHSSGVAGVARQHQTSSGAAGPHQFYVSPDLRATSTGAPLVLERAALLNRTVRGAEMRLAAFGGPQALNAAQALHQTAPAAVGAANDIDTATKLTNATIQLAQFNQAFQQQQQQPASLSLGESALVVALISLIIVSIVGNCLVCVAIFTDRRLRKLGNAFIVSLAIADLFVSCLVMTFALCNDLMNYWMFGDWFCDIWISFDVMCSTASILNLCAISLDRFIHIKDCLLYNQWMTRRVAISAVIIIWFISGLVSFVPITLGWHKPPDSQQQQQQQQQQQVALLHAYNYNAHATTSASANLSHANGHLFDAGAEPDQAARLASLGAAAMLSSDRRRKRRYAPSGAEPVPVGQRRTRRRDNLGTSTPIRQIGDVAAERARPEPKLDYHLRAAPIENPSVNSGAAGQADFVSLPSSASSLGVSRRRARRQIASAALASEEGDEPGGGGGGGGEQVAPGDAQVSRPAAHLPQEQTSPGEQQLPQCVLTLTPTYAVVSSTISFYIPCIIMLGLYSKLFACARRHVRNIRAVSRMVPPAPLAASGPASGSGVGGGQRADALLALAPAPAAATATKADEGATRPQAPAQANSNAGNEDKEREPDGQPRTARDTSGAQTGVSVTFASLPPPSERANGDDTGRRGGAKQQGAAAKLGLLGPARTWIKFGRRDVQHAGDSHGARPDKARPEERRPFLSIARKTGNSGSASEFGAPDAPRSKSSSVRRNLAAAVGGGAWASCKRSKLAASGSSQSQQSTNNNLSDMNNNNNNNGSAASSQTQKQSQQNSKQTTSQLATHKAAITLGIIMGTFLFCWVPFFCLNIIKAFCVDCIPSSMFRAFTWLGYANSALNPIIYGIHNSEFRNAFNRIFFKHLTLKTGRQYLSRRFSYDLRQHHHQHHQHYHHHHHHQQQRQQQQNHYTQQALDRLG